MFKHVHPYEPFLFEEAEKLIVGTLPPPRFTQRELKPGDVDFCYGSRDGQLWKILDHIFKLDLVYETTPFAVEQRKAFLKRRKIGICDIVAMADREKIDASDLGMQQIQLRDLLGYLERYRKIETLLFTGGNSKNGPEYLFRRLLKTAGLELIPVKQEIPRIHKFLLHTSNGKTREIRTVSLIAPSGAANRAVGSIPAYKAHKTRNPSYTTLDFRAEQYSAFF
ncbi:MAG: uracil-DNA glycosylase family protein [Eudoraea sp.]|nr:uracil-DNA glycosylase family protein [Eudoraea sp.]NNJ39670.1 uracil-DNA glycosylase family protein [Eudoraea sp.]